MSDSDPPEDGAQKTLKLALVKRNPWFLALAGLPAILALAFAGLGIITKFAVFVALVPQLLVLASALSMMVWTSNPRPQEIENGVRIDKNGVQFVNTPKILRREEIKAGFIVPRPDKRPIVRLEKPGLSLATEIRGENEADGRKVLRRLGLDPTQTTTSFILPAASFAGKSSPIQKKNSFVWIGIGIIVLGRIIQFHVELLAPLIAIAAMIGGLYGRLLRTHLSIGADGIALRTFRAERFIPYRKIKKIEPYEITSGHGRRWAGVHLKLRGGETITLPISSAGSVGGPRLSLVRHRLAQALADHRRGIRLAAETNLNRGKKELSAWVSELRRAGSGASADHRNAPLPTDRLLDLVENPHADAILRANAAIALGANEENTELRKRMRIAAQTTAAPRLRVALEKATETDDEAALAEALAEVEAEVKKSSPTK